MPSALGTGKFAEAGRAIDGTEVVDAITSIGTSRTEGRARPARIAAIACNVAASSSSTRVTRWLPAAASITPC